MLFLIKECFKCIVLAVCIVVCIILALVKMQSVCGIFSAPYIYIYIESSIQFSSVQFKMVSMLAGGPICAPPTPYPRILPIVALGTVPMLAITFSRQCVCWSCSTAGHPVTRHRPDTLALRSRHAHLHLHGGGGGWRGEFHCSVEDLGGGGWRGEFHCSVHTSMGEEVVGEVSSTALWRI